jgi:hypothetical protein
MAARNTARAASTSLDAGALLEIGFVETCTGVSDVLSNKTSRIELKRRRVGRTPAAWSLPVIFVILRVDERTAPLARCDGPKRAYVESDAKSDV